MPKAKRAPANLTDYKVRALRPDPAGEYVQGDTQVPGLGIRVRPSGAMSYIVMKRLPGQTKPTRVTLGRVEHLSLQDARQKARAAIGATLRGVRINAEKRRERRRVRQAEADTGYLPDTFGETAERYIRTECQALARGRDVESIIRRQLLPVWDQQPVAALRRRDLTDVLDPIVASGRTQAAHKVREVAIRIVNWAIDRGDIEVNYLASPSRGRRRAGIIRRTRRTRVLNDEEIRAIWRAGGEIPWPFGDFVRLALLLAQRRSEIAGMEWKELKNLDVPERAVWVIPAWRHKPSAAQERADHAVPLSPMALDLIRSMPRVCDRFVFSTEPGTHFSGFSKAKAQLDALAGFDDWRIHDLRRTVRTNLSGLVSSDIAERVIGHTIGGVRAVYDLYAYLDEKRDALDRWAARLRGIVEPPPPNVVELRAGAGS
jgi:integrase